MALRTTGRQLRREVPSSSAKVRLVQEELLLFRPSVVVLPSFSPSLQTYILLVSLRTARRGILGSQSITFAPYPRRSESNISLSSFSIS